MIDTSNGSAQIENGSQGTQSIDINWKYESNFVCAAIFEPWLNYALVIHCCKTSLSA